MVPAARGLTALATSPAYAGSGTAGFDKKMQPVLRSYLAIHELLAADSTKGVAAKARAIVKAAAKLDPRQVTGVHAGHYKDLPKKLSAAASALAKSENLAAARVAFKELSKPMAMWVAMSKPAGTTVAYCQMAKASWVQKGKAIRNPYYGADMLTCGQIVGGAEASEKNHDAHGSQGNHGNQGNHGDHGQEQGCH